METGLGDEAEDRRRVRALARSGVVPAPENAGSLMPLFWAGLVCLVLSLGVVVFAQRQLDYPIMLFLNQFQGRAVLLEKLLLAPGRFDVLGGPVFIAGLWLAWVDAPAPASRARVVAGLLGASVGGAISRVLQLSLPSHPRPIHDHGLSFVPPPWIDATALNHWNSFPSDHAALFFGLATVVFFVHPRLGIAAFVWALLVDMNRVYDGIHFFSDVTGGAGLGVVCVCVFQLPRIRSLCGIVVRWARNAPGPFYACAFLLTYEVANLFEDVRDFGHALGKLLRGP